MMILGLLCVAASLLPLYLKYRVVLTGERCKGKITGIKEQNSGYVIRGIPVKKTRIPDKNRAKTVLHSTWMSDFIFGTKKNRQRDLGIQERKIWSGSFCVPGFSD